MSIILDEEAPPFDPESRRLCGDPACIGVIGTDGHCRECGRIGEGEEPRVHRLETDDPVAELASAAVSHQSAEPAVAEEEEQADDDSLGRSGAEAIEDRRLCSDPGCIGVLNAEGRCSECGRTSNLA